MEDANNLPQGDVQPTRSLSAGVAAGGLVEVLSLVSHGSGLGAIVGVAAGVAAWRYVPALSNRAQRLFSAAQNVSLRKTVDNRVAALRGLPGPVAATENAQMTQAPAPATPLAALAAQRPQPKDAGFADNAVPGADDDSDLVADLIIGASAQRAAPGLYLHAAKPAFEGRFTTSGLIVPRQADRAFLFSELLDQGFWPTLDKIYLCTRQNGEHVFGKASELQHTAIAGGTQRGKTSIQRLLEGQLCAAAANVLALSVHNTRYRLDKKEDWTPFEGTHPQTGKPYLLYPLLECRKYEVIEHYLNQLARVKMPERLENFAIGKFLGNDYYAFLDELPDLVGAIPKATENLSLMLRQGLKLGLNLVVASQDFQVETLRLKGGAIRGCFGTVYYTGSNGADRSIGPALLGTNDIPESRLRPGTVMMRNLEYVPAAEVVYVAKMDNSALYRLLGPSTYQPFAANEREESMPLNAFPGFSLAAKAPEEKPTVAPVVAVSNDFTIAPEGHVVLPGHQRVDATQQQKRLMQVRMKKRERPVYASEGHVLPVPVEAIQVDSSLSKDEQLVLATYQDGVKSGNAIAAETDLSATRVNQILNKLARRELIDWQPRKV